MKISDFCSIFELVAAINIAYVVVEYAKNYTNILAHNVFKLEETINSRFNQIVLIFEDRKGLETIKELVINQYNMIKDIERCKIELDKLQKEVSEEKQNLITSIDEKCFFRNFSNQCLWSFFFAVLALFFAGLEQTEFSLQIAYSLFYLAIGTLLYFTIGWIWGESSNAFFKEHFSRLLFVIKSFFIVLGISIFLGFVVQNAVNLYANWMIALFPIIPFLNFILYFIVSFRKIRNIKNTLQSKSDDLCNRCKSWGFEADKIINAHNLTLGVLTQ